MWPVDCSASAMAELSIELSIGWASASIGTGARERFRSAISNASATNPINLSLRGPPREVVRLSYVEIRQIVPGEPVVYGISVKEEYLPHEIIL